MFTANIQAVNKGQSWEEKIQRNEEKEGNERIHVDN